MESEEVTSVKGGIKNKDVEFLMKNDTRYGIITALKLYGSLNLKELGEVLGKSETTLIHHVHTLLEHKFIEELDKRKIGKRRRGKFYVLSKKTQIINDMIIQQYWGKDHSEGIKKLMNKTAEEFNDFVVSELKNLGDIFHFLSFQFKGSAIMNKNLVEITLQKYQTILGQLKRNKKIDVPMGTTNSFITSIPIISHKVVLKIAELTNNYLLELTKLEREIKDEIDQNTEEVSLKNYQYIYVFTAPISSGLND
ncbi:MAG: winged helix-turn-helix domain-containing protein [Candidatus Hodarchaeales archaeon]